MKRRRGMTRAELLIVVFLLILMAALVMPGLGRHRGETRAICGTNLSEIFKAMAGYAAGYNDHLPTDGGSPKLQWLSDEPPQTGKAVMDGTASLGSTSEKIFYCPNNRDLDPTKMWSWNGISVWGYAFLNDRGPGATNMSHNFPAHTPPLDYHPKLNTSDAADTELAMDWITSDSPDAASGQFAGLTRPGSPALTYSTSHLASKNKPAGGNVLNMDGSVKWRVFDPKTATPIKQAGPTPMCFWLPASQ